jgi:hypothetical protein
VCSATAVPTAHGANHGVKASASRAVGKIQRRGRTPAFSSLILMTSKRAAIVLTSGSRSGQLRDSTFS